MDSSKLKKIISICNLYYGNDLISDNSIAKNFWKYLCEKEESNGDNIYVTLHTGSVIFDSLIIFFSWFLAIFNNKSTTEDVIKSLRKGDMVLYEKSNNKIERYVFEGIEEGYNSILNKNMNFAIIVQDKDKKKNSSKVPETLWHRIKPYFGQAEEVGGKGIRNNTLKSEFFKSVLKTNVPNTISVSSIIICRKQYYEEVFDNLIIEFENKRIRLSELTTASFYTDNAETRHSGNPENSEPTLKFTNSIEIARQELINKNNNNTCSVFILGDDIISKNITEYPSIINRKKIPFLMISTRVDSLEIKGLIVQSEKSVEYYACTKNNILLNNFNYYQNHNETIKHLYITVKNIINRNPQTIIVGKLLNLQEYLQLKKTIKKIKNSDYESEEKNLFILDSYSLLKLFYTAPFYMNALNEAISGGKISGISPDSRLNRIFLNIQRMPDYLKKDCEYVFDRLCEIYSNVEKESGMHKELIKILNNRKREKILIVCNKSYYETVLEYLHTLMFLKLKKINSEDNEIEVTTPSKFDASNCYDTIIIAGDISGKRFNQYECVSAKNIISLLYESDEYMYRIHETNKIREKEEMLGNIKEEYNKDFNFYKSNYKTVEDIEALDKDLEDFISKINSSTSYIKSFSSSGDYTKNVETIAIATFENGDKAFFTKMFKAYVYDQSKSQISEVKVEDIRIGDQILFVRSNEKTRDIVDNILNELIDKGKLSSNQIEYYNMSKYWKEVLLTHKNKNGLSTKELAYGLKTTGVSVTETTIRGWLDEDAHTVGPKFENDLLYIGKYLNDEKLSLNYHGFYEGCANTRKIRRTILDYIATAIMKRLSGEKPERGSMYEQIYESVEQLGELLEIESITFTNNLVPMYMINRPLSI